MSTRASRCSYELTPAAASGEKQYGKKRSSPGLPNVFQANPHATTRAPPARGEIFFDQAIGCLATDDLQHIRDLLSELKLDSFTQDNSREPGSDFSTQLGHPKSSGPEMVDGQKTPVREPFHQVGPRSFSGEVTVYATNRLVYSRMPRKRGPGRSQGRPSGRTPVAAGSMNDVTQILWAIGKGDPRAAGELLPLLYASRQPGPGQPVAAGRFARRRRYNQRPRLQARRRPSRRDRRRAEASHCTLCLGERLGCGFSLAGSRLDCEDLHARGIVVHVITRQQVLQSLVKGCVGARGPARRRAAASVGDGEARGG